MSGYTETYCHIFFHLKIRLGGGVTLAELLRIQVLRVVIDIESNSLINNKTLKKIIEYNLNKFSNYKTKHLYLMSKKMENSVGRFNSNICEIGEMLEIMLWIRQKCKFHKFILLYYIAFSFPSYPSYIQSLSRNFDNSFQMIGDRVRIMCTFYLLTLLFEYLHIKYLI